MDERRTAFYTPILFALPAVTRLELPLQLRLLVPAERHLYEAAEVPWKVLRGHKFYSRISMASLYIETSYKDAPRPCTASNGDFVERTRVTNGYAKIL